MLQAVTEKEIDLAIEMCLRKDPDTRPLVSNVAAALQMTVRELERAWRASKLLVEDHPRRLRLG